MHIVYPRCCGLDVHKSTLSACILLVGAESKERHMRPSEPLQETSSNWPDGSPDMA